MSGSSQSTPSSPSTSRLARTSTRNRSAVPPSTPSERQSFTRITTQLNRRRATGNVNVRERAEVEAKVRGLNSTASERIREAYAMAGTVIESRDYRLESTREIDDESQLGYEARMYVVSKKNLSLALEELQIF